jgi:hypothetical protein
VGYVFAGLEVALLVAGKPDGSLVNSVGTTVEEGWERCPEFLFIYSCYAF